ncbi:MAG: type II toxin-antitoxin system RelE/ParE family toxin [Verrucomicrobiota bacterium]
MRVQFLPEANLEIIEAIDYYLEIDLELAQAFERELRQAEADICEMPDAWRPLGKGLRRKLFENYPYGLIYHKIGPDLLEVVSVVALRRKPNYWRKRLD